MNVTDAVRTDLADAITLGVLHVVSEGYQNRHEVVDFRPTKTGVTVLTRCGCAIRCHKGVVPDDEDTPACHTCGQLRERNCVRRLWPTEEAERYVVETEPPSPEVRRAIREQAYLRGRKAFAARVLAECLTVLTEGEGWRALAEMRGALERLLGVLLGDGVTDIVCRDDAAKAAVAAAVYAAQEALGDEL